MYTNSETERAQPDRRSVLVRTFARFDKKTSDIILAALLAFSVAVFTYGLTAQAKMAERVRVCETLTALNTQSLTDVKGAVKETEQTLTNQICAFLEIVNHRFESLENLLNIVLETTNKGE